MSFDLFLQAFDAGESAQVDRSKVLAVLREHCQESADTFGFYLVRFPDGSDVEFSAKGLESNDDFTGCGFHVHGFSRSVVGFIFDVAKAGDMVIFNAQGTDTVSDPTVILTEPSQRDHLPKLPFANAVLCSSTEHLAKLLGVGFEKWVDYRNLVVGRNSS